MKLSTSSNIVFDRPEGPFFHMDRMMRYAKEAGFDTLDISFYDWALPGSPFLTDEWKKWIDQVAEEKGAQIEIETVPGVTAASAAASVLGAPLMHDFAVISLSDLMTPLDLIMKRVDCAGQGDLIVCLYNPKSKKRVDYVEKAADILMKYRKTETPVGIVRNAGRKDESHCITTLGALKDADIDMFSVVIIGNSQTYEKNGRMITPRGYRL